MKKILLSIFTLAVIGITTNVQAQCTLSNPNITINFADDNDDEGPCELELTLEFDLIRNGGNTYVWFNIWKSEDYTYVTPNPYLKSGGQLDDAPTLDQLNGLDNTHGPVAVIGINTSNSQYLSIYTADNNITPVTGTNIVATPTGVTDQYHYVLSGITFSTPGACDGLVLQGDVWGSQANSGSPKLHCLTQGISFLGDPTIQGGVNCTVPNNTFTVNFSTVSTTPFIGNYKVYIDNGEVGTYEPGIDDLAYTHVPNVNFSAGSPYNSGQLQYEGNDVNPTYTRPLIVELELTSPFSSVYYYLLDNNCIPLPVKLKSFTASRKQTNVELKWVTTMEQNNNGFELQRQSGAGGWQTIGFVKSKATDGNSVTDLNYSYTDANDLRGVSQYRLRQVDMDDNAKYSEIRSVQGIGQEARTIISPNPSANGRVNVTFQSASSKKDLQLTDMHGRMLKQWNAYSDNSLQITDLTPGIYQLRITDRETGTQSVEKIMVVNR